MDRSEEIAEFEQRLQNRRREIERLVDELRGWEAQLASMKSRVQSGTDLADAPRTEAIMSVLLDADLELSPSEILGRLHAAGRNDDLRSVTATLGHLINKDRVIRPSRGMYRPL